MDIYIIQVKSDDNSGLTPFSICYPVVSYDEAVEAVMDEITKWVSEDADDSTYTTESKNLLCSAWENGKLEEILEVWNDMSSLSITAEKYTFTRKPIVDFPAFPFAT